MSRPSMCFLVDTFYAAIDAINTKLNHSFNEVSPNCLFALLQRFFSLNFTWIGLPSLRRFIRRILLANLSLSMETRRKSRYGHFSTRCPCEIGV
jgi:hypothetical protein